MLFIELMAMLLADWLLMTTQSIGAGACDDVLDSAIPVRSPCMLESEESEESHSPNLTSRDLRWLSPLGSKPFRRNAQILSSSMPSVSTSIVAPAIAVLEVSC